MSAHGTTALTAGRRDRAYAHRKRPPRNAGASGSSKRRVVAARVDSMARQRATTVAVRLTVSGIVLFPPPQASEPGPGPVLCQVTRLVPHCTPAAFACPTLRFTGPRELQHGTLATEAPRPLESGSSG